MVQKQKSSKVGLVIGTGAIIVLLALTGYYWTGWLAHTEKTHMVDYSGIALNYFLSDPVGCLFGQTEGSGPMLPYFGIGLIWIWTSYFVVRRFPRMETFFWGNLAWCLAATLIVLLAWVYGAATQHFQWYACFYHCAPGEEGTMDKVTHFLTPAALMAILTTINLQDSLGMHGRKGRMVELGILIAVAVLVPVWWEYAETLAPAVYTSVYMNSITDMLTGWVSSLFMIGWYNWIVPYEGT